MRIAAVLAGFSMGQSDVLRKAMGKKDPKVMAKQREAFMDGARARTAINEKKATKIFDLMEFFAGYGFNKSHSTTYAWVAYQTAYLKANYPWHFMAALLTIEAANTDKLAMYLGECRDLGIPILPPDINAASSRSRSRSEGVRFGLCAVKNVGEGAILSMLGVRKELGRIDSLHTLCEHADLRLVNKRVARKPDQGRRARLAGCEQHRAVRDRARPPVRRRRQGDRARRPPSARPRRRAVAALRRRRRRRAPPRRSRCPTRRRGPRRSSWPSRRKRSAST